MNSSNILRSALLAAVVLAGLNAYAGMTSDAREDDVIGIGPEILKKAADLDKKINDEASVYAKSDTAYDKLYSKILNKESEREGMQLTQTTTEPDYYYSQRPKKRTKTWSCSEMENYSGSCTGYNQFYGSNICSQYRSCQSWYDKKGVSVATTTALRRELNRLENNRDNSESHMADLRTERENLYKANGRELRSPEDLSELRETKTMQFNKPEALGAQSGVAIRTANDCTFTLTPLSTTEVSMGTWVLGTSAKPKTWKIVFMNQTDKTAKSLEDCSNAYVHAIHKKECEIDVKMNGQYVIPPSVVMTSDDYPGKFLDVHPSIDSGGSKEVLACLTARGYDPGKVLAKIQPKDAPTPMAESTTPSDGVNSAAGAVGAAAAPASSVSK